MSDLRLQRHYLTETPVVVPVRNRALDEASDFAALIFLDNGPLPDDGWLCALVSARQRYGSSIAGPGRVPESLYKCELISPGEPRRC